MNDKLKKQAVLIPNIDIFSTKKNMGGDAYFSYDYYNRKSMFDAFGTQLHFGE